MHATNSFSNLKTTKCVALNLKKKKQTKDKIVHKIITYGYYINTYVFVSTRLDESKEFANISTCAFINVCISVRIYLCTFEQMQNIQCPHIEQKFCISKSSNKIKNEQKPNQTKRRRKGN